MFRIEIDGARQFVSITVMGLLADDEALRYVDTIRSEFVAKIGARPYLLMIDTTHCMLQSKRVVEILTPHIANFTKATRIALVNGDSLVRMQLRRVLTRDYSRFFATVEEAMPWLFHEWPMSRPAASKRAA